MIIFFLYWMKKSTFIFSLNYLSVLGYRFYTRPENVLQLFLIRQLVKICHFPNLEGVNPMVEAFNLLFEQMVKLILVLNRVNFARIR